MQTLPHLFFSAFESAFPGTSTGRLSISSLPGASAALTAAALARRSARHFCLAIATGPAELDHVYGDLCAMGRFSGVDATFFPQSIADDPDGEGARMRVIRSLQNFGGEDEEEDDRLPIVLVTSLPALLQSMPDPAALGAASVTLKKNGAYALDEVAEKLSAAGYSRVPDVDSPGQFAVRGGVLDVWPPAGERPWRAEFFDVELESLRTFDPVTQRSLDTGDSVWLPPCSEAAMKATIHLTDLLPKGASVLWLEHDRLRNAALFEILPAEDADGCQTSWERLLESVKKREPGFQLFSGDPPPPHTASLELSITALPGVGELSTGGACHPELLVQAREKLFRTFLEKAGIGEDVFLCADTAGTAEMLNRELMSLQSTKKDGAPAGPLSAASKAVHVQRLSLSGGFLLPGLTVAAQPDLYAVRKQVSRRPSSAVARKGVRIESASDLEPGDYVVHIDHGIGRFLGSTEIEIDGQRTEVFTIEYADKAKLHVPVSQAHLLSKYIGISGRRVTLHRLGGTRWVKEKAAAERAVQDLAGALLETQARRQIVQGTSFNPNPPWMAEFEASFPYQETVDQEKTIADIKKDMEVPRPMDRLICGDAGYGKTEIAMRAAFIAVMNGYQVAVLVPTTVLAEQHYETFCDRMANFPVQIAAVDRFHSPAKRQEVWKGVAAGTVDIVIGTHALLSGEAAFKKLGLLMIDEEQRFGVAHKEKLKVVRQMIDVLTLSATPIPRTLYMSMTGARDMSLLQTPPRERVAVETRIARDTDVVLRSSIQQELNRGGQVYFLYNRVMTISLMLHRLEKLLPEARIAIAHGQMPSSELSEIMKAFEAGEIDVLLCTTIVENGLDIPRANTIIVHRADRFGIADLYQLRGRVGRSSQKGYAWLLLPESGSIDSEARDRIEALKKHSGLSAGFNLALRDLEIRGAGNLLGREQSGQIAAIGFGLYCQLLKRTIARMKGEKPPLLVDVDTQIDFLDFSPGTIHPESSACVPYSYMEDEGHRMVFHRRLAEMSSAAEVKALKREIDDRYGKPPAAVSRLLKLADLRILAARKKIGRIETDAGKIYLYPQNSREPILIKNRLPLLSGKTAEQKLASISSAISVL